MKTMRKSSQNKNVAELKEILAERFNVMGRKYLSVQKILTVAV